MTPDPRTPSTEAGRALLDWLVNSSRTEPYDADAQSAILAIEAEARATATIVDITGIDAIERAVTADLLAQIEKAVLGLPGMNGRHDAIGGALEVRRSDVLAAIRSAAPVEP